LSNSFYVWFDAAYLICEYLARIAMFLVKTAKLIQSPRPVHVFGGAGGGGHGLA